MFEHPDNEWEDACDIDNDRRCPGKAFEWSRARQPSTNDAYQNAYHRVESHHSATLPETHRALPLSHRVYENVVDEQPRLLPGGGVASGELANANPISVMSTPQEPRP